MKINNILILLQTCRRTRVLLSCRRRKSKKDIQFFLTLQELHSFILVEEQEYWTVEVHNLTRDTILSLNQEQIHTKNKQKFRRKSKNFPESLHKKSANYWVFFDFKNFKISLNQTDICSEQRILILLIRGNSKQDLHQTL